MNGMQILALVVAVFVLLAILDKINDNLKKGRK